MIDIMPDDKEISKALNVLNSISDKLRFNLLKILLKSCFFEKRLPIFKQRGIM